jgi:hypothetical protein
MPPALPVACDVTDVPDLVWVLDQARRGYRSSVPRRLGGNDRVIEFLATRHTAVWRHVLASCPQQAQGSLRHLQFNAGLYGCDGASDLAIDHDILSALMRRAVEQPTRDSARFQLARVIAIAEALAILRAGCGNRSAPDPCSDGSGPCHIVGAACERTSVMPAATI